MALTNFVKNIRNIMRNDAGINGDAQRIEQIAWMLFLKIYDEKENDWEFNLMKMTTNPSFLKIVVGATGHTMKEMVKP